MRKGSVATIIRGLNDAGIRYLVAGGLAVVAHGFLRFTADLDLILDLEEANVRKAVAVFQALGYRPRAPVPFEDFASPAARASWANDKGMTVFSLFSDQHPETEVDLFIEAPLDFERAYRKVDRKSIDRNLDAPFVSFTDLVAMKQAAGRPQDLEDLRKLQLGRGESDDAG